MEEHDEREKSAAAAALSKPPIDFSTLHGQSTDGTTRHKKKSSLNDPKTSGSPVLASESLKEESAAPSTTELPKNDILTGTNVIKGSRADLIDPNKNKPSFSEQLYDILEDERNGDVLAWMPCGTKFQVVNQKKFAMYKMAKLFNIRNMSSFVRKLVRWGFTRLILRDMAHSDVFYHPHFIRGNRGLITRKVKCLGRLLGVKAATMDPAAAQQSQSQLYSTAHIDLPQSLSYRQVQQSMPWHHHQNSYMNQPNTEMGLSAGTVPGLDQVADASTMSAERLYSSMMAPNNGDPMDIELQKMLRQREMQARDLEIQRRRLVMEQKQLQEAAMRMSVQGNMIDSRPLTWHSGMIHRPGGPVSSVMSRQIPNGHDDARWQNQFLSMQQGLDRIGAMTDSFAQRVSHSVGAPDSMDQGFAAVNMSEDRSRSRKAAIAALVEEEQHEWEAKQAASAAAIARTDQTQLRAHAAALSSSRRLGWPKPPPLSPPKTPSPEQRPGPEEKVTPSNAKETR